MKGGRNHPDNLAPAHQNSLPSLPLTCLAHFLDEFPVLALWGVGLPVEKVGELSTNYNSKTHRDNRCEVSSTDLFHVIMRFHTPTRRPPLCQKDSYAATSQRPMPRTYMLAPFYPGDLTKA